MKKLSQEDFEIFAADDSAVKFAFGNLLIKWARQVKAGDDSALDSLKWHAHRVLQLLLDLAKQGSESAAKELHGIIEAHVSQFDKFSHHRAEFFEPIARKTTVWPALISCDSDIEKRNEKLLAALKLGDDAPLNYSGKPWTRGTPETSVALELWSLLETYRKGWLNRKAEQKLLADDWKEINARAGKPANYRPKLRQTISPSPEMAEEFRLRSKSEKLARKLQPLNRKNYPKWFEAAKPAFCAQYGNEFQDHKKFAGKEANARAIAAKQGKKLRGVFRKLILKGVENGFKSIAPKPVNVE